VEILEWTSSSNAISEARTELAAAVATQSASSAQATMFATPTWSEFAMPSTLALEAAPLALMWSSQTENNAMPLVTSTTIHFADFAPTPVTTAVYCRHPVQLAPLSTTAQTTVPAMDQVETSLATVRLPHHTEVLSAMFLFAAN